MIPPAKGSTRSPSGHSPLHTSPSNDSHYPLPDCSYPPRLLLQPSTHSAAMQSSSSRHFNLDQAHDREYTHPHDDLDESATTSSTASIIEQDDSAEALVAELNNESEDQVHLSATVVRILALLCACSLSVGSHYGMYFLGPLKSRLSREIGTTNTEFSLLLAAYNINNTWTPLVGGVMTARLGTALTSIIATSLILSGQVILLAGDYAENVKVMVIGLFIFGLGISPLAVVQETIIVRYFCHHGLGVSLAVGLVAGKFTSFLSAYTSYPLSRAYGPHAPFVVSTILAAISFAFNIVYMLASSWFTRGAGLAPEAADVQRRLAYLRSKVSGERMTEREALEKVAAKRNIKVKDLAKLGDVFWLFIAINVLCGAIWSPFTHLAANIFEKRYALSELDASEQASLLLAGSIVLYPICGFLTDRLKKGPVVHYLFILSAALTLFCYCWLILPPSWTQTVHPAVLTFGFGHGFSTLLLVIIVPHLVPIQYVSTALGAHKALESCGSTISKILAGLLLDAKGGKGETVESISLVTRFVRTVLRPPIDSHSSIQWVLNAWFFVNVVQFACTIGLWRLDVHRKQSEDHWSRREATTNSRGGYVPVTSVEDPPFERERAHIKADLAAISGRNPWVEDPTHLVEENAVESATSPSVRFDDAWARPPTPETLLNAPAPSTPPTPNYTTFPEEPTLKVRNHHRTSSFASLHGDPVAVAKTRSEKRRGKMFMACSIALVLSTWTLFFATAYAKISGKEK